MGEHLKFDLQAAHRDSKLAASAAVPLWAEDLRSVFSNEPEVDIELEHSMDRIPNSFMTLGELYLALLALERSKLVFLDRPLSGTYSTLSRDARNLLKRGESKLVKWGSGYGVSLLDIDLAVNLGSPAMAVPTRRRFLPLAVVRLLMAGPKGFGELAASLGVDESEVRRAAKSIRNLDSRHGNTLPADSSASGLKLNEGVSGYWDRISALSLAYAKDVFGCKKHPLALGNEQYLTILDVNTVALFLLGMLYQRAQETGALLIGIAKDTTATDITRAVLPFAASSGFVRLSSAPLGSRTTGRSLRFSVRRTPRSRPPGGP